MNIARDFLIDIGGGNLATEEVEVELKAKAGNLQQTLEKMQKTLDKLSSGKHEMNLNTNADAIVKSLGSDIHENYIGVRLTQLTKTTYSSHVFCYGRLQCTLMYLLNVALSPFLIAFRYTSIMQ